jgi:hypothetical protein
MNVFRKRIYHTLDELQTGLDTWLKEYNEVRPHSGKCCFGKTPMQMFLDTLPLVRERVLNQIVQTTAEAVYLSDQVVATTLWPCSVQGHRL